MSSFTAPPRWQTDPAAVKRIGVVCDGTLYTFTPDGEHDRTDEARMPLEVVIECAIIRGCAALWLLPTPDEDQPFDWPLSAYTVLRADPQFFTVHELSGRNGVLSGLICQGRVRGERVPMGVYPAWHDLWGIAGHLADLPEHPIARACAFALGITEAARALAMQLRFSPSYTGLQAMRQQLAAHAYPIPALTNHYREIIREHQPSYYQWCREIDKVGQGTWIFKYDRNASFLASASEVPVGDPLPTERYVEGCHGLYEVSCPWPQSGYSSAHLPGPFRVGERAGTYPATFDAPTWVWEPQLRIAARLGYSVRIHRGYYWPRAQKHDALRGWRDRLWAARQGAREPLARALVKRVGVASIGRLGQRQGHAVMSLAQASQEGYRIRSQEVDSQGHLTGMGEVLADLGRVDLVQPHWWASIIANATERLQTALYEHRAYHPVAGYVDAVYCLSPWPLDDLAPDRLGKWKLERQVWVTAAEVRELNALAASPQHEGAYAWVARLAALARAGGQDPIESEADPDGEQEEA